MGWEVGRRLKREETKQGGGELTPSGVLHLWPKALSFTGTKQEGSRGLQRPESLGKALMPGQPEAEEREERAGG